MKRADLDTATVLRTLARYTLDAYDVLAQRFPRKIVLAAFEREVDRGLIEYGTWLGRPWLTPEGRQWLAENVGTMDVSGWRPAGYVDDQPGPPFAHGGIVRGPGAKDDDRVPIPLTGCMFADVARVFVIPDGERKA